MPAIASVMDLNNRYNMLEIVMKILKPVHNQLENKNNCRTLRR